MRDTDEEPEPADPELAAGKSKSDDWCTPPEIGDPLIQLFDGPVDVDPCSNPRSIILARMAYQTGGLVLPWRYRLSQKRTVYENDPYSKSEVWTRKTLHELACGNVIELVRLTIMATSSKWWSDMCLLPARNPRILALRRIKFLDPDAAVPGMRRMTCRFEPALTYIGPRPAAFVREFRHMARWQTWGR